MRVIALAALLLPLTGCDTRVTLQEVCEGNPQMCADVPLTGWCVKERSQVIWTRYEHQDSDRHTLYNELIALENYVKCMEKATMIENRVVAKERETARIESYLASQKSLNKLQNSTAGDVSPYVTFYRWTRLNDTQALGQFLESERRGELDTVVLKQFAATYYSRINPEKAVDYLLDTLNELPYPAIDTYLQLSKEYLNLDRPTQAYLFAKLVSRHEPKLVNEQRLRLLASSTKVDRHSLDKRAEQIDELLEAGRFTPENLKL
ncbi:DUF2989 domain-containing protein [Ferrimonas sediminicola]|uniref:DUF2989 domain-containing protein n=1 Tax=Ferrimonas sediminicola TaxID=2569538 RepID=A0A4U1BC49_9GAMM|nr:DUF2989 domain-containing protein [Ferrimonas sediminicola]TKB48531.1 DUF2989 domain-containing protein [Ferrimonas sediminicola]